VSHWAVSSEAATRLATSTFDRLKADPKMGRTEALRQAMLGYLNDKSSPRNAYPAFWAICADRRRRGALTLRLCTAAKKFRRDRVSRAREIGALRAAAKHFCGISGLPPE